MASPISEETRSTATENNTDFIEDETTSPTLEPELDVGNLLTVDPTPLSSKDLSSSTNSYLKQLATKNIQLLINKIWEIPTETVEDAIVVKLPKGTTTLPRAKPIPKAKPPTKWEQYAKDKGIHKQKKEKLVWDETAKDWRPRYGYRSINSEKKDWLLEVPENADPNTDVYQKKREQKNERVAKNEYQKLRNIARAQKLKMPSRNLVQGDKPTKKQLSQAINIAKRSTASIGEFSESLADNKKPKEMGKKRKFQSTFGDINEEKNKCLRIVEQLSNKAPKLDVTKAVNFQKHQDERKKSSGNRKSRQDSNPSNSKKNSKSFIRRKQEKKNQKSRGSKKQQLQKRLKNNKK